MDCRIGSTSRLDPSAARRDMIASLLACSSRGYVYEDTPFEWFRVEVNITTTMHLGTGAKYPPDLTMHSILTARIRRGCKRSSFTPHTACEPVSCVLGCRPSVLFGTSSHLPRNTCVALVLSKFYSQHIHAHTNIRVHRVP